MFNVLKWFKQEKKDSHQLGKVTQTRRFFLKGVAMTGGALAAAASMAGFGNKIKEDYQAAYDRDVIPGDKILQDNGFEEVSKEETDAMVQMFVDDYKHKRQV